jgi:hypothetical protein
MDWIMNTDRGGQTRAKVILPLHREDTKGATSKPRIKPATQKYGRGAVSYVAKLHGVRRRRSHQNHRGGHNKVFTSEQERTLYNIIVDRERVGKQYVGLLNIKPSTYT